jgi:hypothetical protein
VNDFKLLRATLESIVIERPDIAPDAPQGLCLDKGYDYPEVYALLDELSFTGHIRSRGEEKKALEREQGFRARRWSSNAPTPGSTASAACSSAGAKSPTTTARCSNSPAA